MSGQKCALCFLYLISIKDLPGSSRTVRHSHQQRWEEEGVWGGHLCESTNCSVYFSHCRQKPVRLMWNDDLARSVTGDWRQLGAGGTQRTDLKQRACGWSRHCEPRLNPQPVSAVRDQRVTWMTGYETMKQLGTTGIKRVQVTGVEKRVRWRTARGTEKR